MTITRIPTDPSHLSELMQRQPAPAPKPDLWDRLVAQEGAERATETWMLACAHYDALHAHDPRTISDDELDAATASYYVRLLEDEARHYDQQAAYARRDRKTLEAIRAHGAAKALRDVARGWRAGIERTP